LTLHTYPSVPLPERSLRSPSSLPSHSTGEFLCGKVCSLGIGQGGSSSGYRLVLAVRRLMRLSPGVSNRRRKFHNSVSWSCATCALNASDGGQSFKHRHSVRISDVREPIPSCKIFNLEENGKREGSLWLITMGILFHAQNGYIIYAHVSVRLAAFVLLLVLHARSIRKVRRNVVLHSEWSGANAMHKKYPVGNLSHPCG
jgi:hypothetical protein